MPSRMIHYLIAKEVAKQVENKDINRCRLGSLCPDMAGQGGAQKLPCKASFNAEEGLEQMSCEQKKVVVRPKAAGKDLKMVSPDKYYVPIYED